MLQKADTFSGFSVMDLTAAKEFYTNVLGLEVEESRMGLQLKLEGNKNVYIYQKDDHVPATFTVLNFVVADINAAVTEMVQNGIQFEQYDFGNGAKTDESGVMRGLAAHMGPDIAWFKDPSGNILAVLQDK